MFFNLHFKLLFESSGFHMVSSYAEMTEADVTKS